MTSLPTEATRLINIGVESFRPKMGRPNPWNWGYKWLAVWRQSYHWHVRATRSFLFVVDMLRACAIVLPDLCHAPLPRQLYEG